MGALTPANGVTLLGYTVWPEQLQERFSRTEQWVRMSIICKWTDRIGFRQLLLGGSRLVGGVITTTAPYAHPNYSWMLVCDVRAEMAPGSTGYTNDSNNFIACDYARLTVEFNQLDPLDLGEEKIEFSGRMITAPPEMFTWASDGEALLSSEAPGIIEVKASLERTINTVASLPLTTIFGLIGKVNSSTYLGGAAETMLYLGASSQRRYTTFGSKCWSLTHKIDFSAAGWNQFLRASTGDYEELDPKPYDSADFTPLGIHTSFGV